MKIELISIGLELETGQSRDLNAPHNHPTY